MDRIAPRHIKDVVNIDGPGLLYAARQQRVSTGPKNHHPENHQVFAKAHEIPTEMTVKA